MNVESEKTRSMMNMVCPDWEERAKALALKGTKQSVANVVLFGENASSNSAKLLWGIWDKVRKAGETPDKSDTVVPDAAKAATNVDAALSDEVAPDFVRKAGGLLGVSARVDFVQLYESGRLQQWIGMLSEREIGEFFRWIKMENPIELRKLEKSVLEAVALIKRDGKRFGYWVESTRTTFGARPEAHDANVLDESLGLSPLSNILDVVIKTPQEIEAETIAKAETETEPFDYASAYGLDD